MDNYIQNGYMPSPNCQVQGLINIYRGIFGYRNYGNFLDIGALDGLSYSNTYGLALAGWKGIMLEPVEKFYSVCKDYYKDYPNIVVLNYAAGDKHEIKNIYTGNHACSTMSHEFKSLVENTGYGKDFYKDFEICEVITLDSLLDSFYVMKAFFKGPLDVVSIDVEGYELEVLKGFSIDIWKPKMVIIESHEYTTTGDRPVLAPQINEYFKKNDYIKIYSDDINSIFIRRDL